jgi:hypothetical protein
MTTAASGAYSFPGLQPDTPIEFKLSIPQAAPVVQGLLDTRYVVGTTDTHVRPVNEIGETGGRSIGCEEMSEAASILAA